MAEKCKTKIIVLRPLGCRASGARERERDLNATRPLALSIDHVFGGYFVSYSLFTILIVRRGMHSVFYCMKSPQIIKSLVYEP